MIKLKSIITENIENEVSAFEISLRNQYKEFLEQLHFYYDDQNNSISLTDIYIKPNYKGRGIGSKIMKQLTDFSDLKKIPIVLIPAPDSFKPSALNRLKNFYRRFGFVDDSKTNPRFELGSMYRFPK